MHLILSLVFAAYATSAHAETCPFEQQPELCVRTVFRVQVDTVMGDMVFFRGGDKSGERIRILNNKPHINGWDSYNAWVKGDKYLDWHGAEEGQGDYLGLPAGGTPAYWTDGNIWEIDVDIVNCPAISNTIEFKPYVRRANGQTEWISCTTPGHEKARICPLENQNFYMSCDSYPPITWRLEYGEWRRDYK